MKKHPHTPSWTLQGQHKDRYAYTAKDILTQSVHYIPSLPVC